MNERIKQILIGTGMILLLTFLLFKTNTVDPVSHLRYSTDLRLMKELDATLDKELLELRFGKLGSDQTIKNALVKLDGLRADLRNFPSFLDTASKSQLLAIIEEYDNLNADENLAITLFVEKNEKINSALEEFRRRTEEFEKNAAAGTNRSKYTNKVDDLSRKVFENYYSTSDDFSSGLEVAVIALKTMKEGERSVDISKRFDSMLSSSRTILEVKPERDRLINYLIEIKTATKINDVINFYQERHFDAVNTSENYRLALYAITILLLGYGIHVFRRLNRTSNALNLVNETLEARVDERTNELMLSNIDLQRSENDNNALLGALPDTMWRINGVGIFLNVITTEDDQHTTSSGWEGKTLFDVLPKDQAEKALALTEKALETGERQIFEFNLVKNSKLRHYESRMVVCGSFEVLIIVRDITDLIRAQAKSHLISEIVQGANMTASLEEFLRLIHKLISKVIYAENCFVALYDEEIDSLDIQLFVDKYDPMPQKLKLGKGLTAYVVKNGEPAILTKEQINALVSSGKIELIGTPPAVWVGIPLKTPHGIIGALVVQHYEDINAYDLQDLELLKSIGDQIALAILRKRSENALKESEVRFQQAFDYAPIGICLFSPDGQFQQTNLALCEMIGYSKDELSELRFFEIMNEADRENLIVKQNQMVSGDINSFQLESRFLNKSGELVLALASVSLVRDFNGEPIYFIAQIQNISEQKSMEDQLQRAQKLESIGRLAAGIAHEINTPTQYVSDNTRFLGDSFEGYAMVLEKNRQLLEACKAGNVTAQAISEMENAIEDADIEYLSEEIPIAIKQAIHGVERISKIVQSMKEFAHPGSIDKKAADINKAIESTITVASNEWKYVADLKTEFDPDLPALPCLVGEFNQVVLNMIINASHAIADIVGDGSNGKGTITVTTTRVNEWAEIRIGDTGTGIPEDIRKKIFDPFFTTKEVGKGSGQGLAISHNVIVEKHNGKIEVESELGKGTTFVIKLPIIDSTTLVM